MLDPVRWSDLRNIARSPAHYLHALFEGVKQTPAMRLGSLVHAQVFGTDGFVVYDGDRRGKAWTEFKAAHEGDEIVTLPEVALADDIAEAVKGDPVAGPLLEGITEQRLTWQIGGRECAGTPDVRTDINLVDLKTTADASPMRFPNFALRSAYLGQMAWYLDGIAAAGLPVPSRVYLVAVEVKPPHACVAYELTPGAIEAGRRTWHALFERLLVCEAAGEFPGYAQSPLLLDAPEDVTLTLDGEEMSL